MLVALWGTGCVRKQYFQSDARPAATRPLPAAADSVRGATAGRQYARPGRLYQALVGRHHRRTWAAPVTVPVLRLAAARPGGLTPGKVGGGFNSTSLGLNPTNGPAYVLRTVDKDPIRATPFLLRGTFLVNLLRDNISSTNPYGALVVPPLAAALGVAHASPRLFYVRPDDPAFQGDSLRLFRGQLAYLEEKLARPLDIPGGAAEAMNSTEAFGAVFAGPGQRLDQVALLRARLLDAWLGDWDRHPGQWNWAGRAALEPLPKDRDMVFYRLDDGVLGWLIGHVFLRHWTSFHLRYPHPAHLFSNGHYLDTRGLNGLSRTQFQATARQMQRQLPDTLISRAVRRLPPAAFALEGPGSIAALQARRDALPELATALYQQLSRRPVVGGTAQDERFEIHRYADSTTVAVFSEATTIPSYRRTFYSAETRLIQLESLGGNDTFVVENHSKAQSGRQIRLRLYGGAGTDKFQSKTRTPGVNFRQNAAAAKRAYDRLPEE
ncbi:hypothetical protein [Hymenobacter sp.]|uniref:hypothetical protein n=1 Tax=Hymenobacter sp. TaxID=1898978 RepID=UPI00286C6CAB|nr:hypothetical protein [Hymenobacter sp.]